MPEPGIDYRRIIALLNAAGVRYVIVGGVAMHLHGANNLTLDLDIGYARDRENLAALARSLVQQRARLRGVPADLPFVLDERTFRNTSNLTLQTEAGDLDLLGEAAGVASFDALWGRSVEMEIGDDLSARVASLDDLIAMKRAANRPKDQSHLLELLALRKLIAGVHAQA